MNDLQNENFKEEFFSSGDERDYMLDLHKKRKFDGISPITNFKK